MSFYFFYISEFHTELLQGNINLHSLLEWPCKKKTDWLYYNFYRKSYQKSLFFFMHMVARLCILVKALGWKFINLWKKKALIRGLKLLKSCEITMKACESLLPMQEKGNAKIKSNFFSINNQQANITNDFA